MGELTGVTVGITAERRADEFAGALQRHGATIWHAPTIRITPLADDESLRAATEQVLAAPPEVTVVTTGAGFRGWLQAAEGWGMGERLARALADSEIVVRGPKAKGAVRASGLRERFSPEQETNAALFEHVLARGVRNTRVVVQLHGTALPEHVDAVRAAGGELTEVQPYRWQDPADLGAVDRLVDGVVAGQVSALTFTSAPAATNLLALARDRGKTDRLIATLRGAVLCACVGPVTAGPLEELDVPTVQPERARLGALVKLLVSRLDPAGVRRSG